MIIIKHLVYVAAALFLLTEEIDGEQLLRGRADNYKLGRRVHEAHAVVETPSGQLKKKRRRRNNAVTAQVEMVENTELLEVSTEDITQLEMVENTELLEVSTEDITQLEMVENAELLEVSTEDIVIPSTDETLAGDVFVPQETACPGMPNDMVCFAEFAPVVCAGHCNYSNSCWAHAAGFDPNEDCEHKK